MAAFIQAQVAGLTRAQVAGLTRALVAGPTRDLVVAPIRVLVAEPTRDLAAGLIRVLVAGLTLVPEGLATQVRVAGTQTNGTALDRRDSSASEQSRCVRSSKGDGGRGMDRTCDPYDVNVVLSR